MKEVKVCLFVFWRKLVFPPSNSRLHPIFPPFTVLTNDSSERRQEEEKEEGVPHGHAAGAEEEQEGDGV